jgi:hypothetical protein
MQLVLAIVMFFVAAVCIYLALQPKLAFQLDEGWKFKNKTEPSRTYEGISTFRFTITAFIAVGIGIFLIILYFDARHDAQRKAAAEQSYRNCTGTVLPRFNETIKWDGLKVSNKDELDALAEELGVRVRVESRQDYYGSPLETHYGDVVNVYDPKQPATGGLLFSYIGGSQDGQGPYTEGDHEVHCYTDRERIHISDPLTR